MAVTYNQSTKPMPRSFALSVQRHTKSKIPILPNSDTMTFRNAALMFMPILLIVVAIVPNAQAQAAGITSIANVQYSSQAVLQNGVAKVAVTFTVYYNYYYNPQGYLIFAIYTAGTTTIAKGSAAASPDPCQSLTGTNYADSAVCAVIPATTSGTDSASFTLTFNSAQQYSLTIVSFIWDTRNLQSGNQVNGSTNTSNFAITVTGQAQTSTSSTTTTSLQYPSASSTSNTNIQPPSHVPSTGSWWTLKGNWRRVSTGSGSWAGTLTETGDYTMKVLVTNVNSDTITLSDQENEQWTCAATGTWTCSSASGTKSHTYQYTISLNTFKVISVGGEADKAHVGYAIDIMVNVGQLVGGGKVAQYWWVPNSDGKGDYIASADFGVDTQTVNIKGSQLKVWRLSYSGDVLGWYDNDNGVYSKGPATQTSLYDPVYGIEVAYSFKSNTNGAEVGGSGTWSEAYSDDYQLDDTNLSFTPQVTASSQTTTGAAATSAATTSTATSVATTSTATSSTASQDSTWFYIVAVGLVAVIVVLVVVMMRRRTVAPQPPQRTSATTPSTAPAGERFCISCGSRIPAFAPFCPRCGERQS